jgi:hypothetical protein
VYSSLGSNIIIVIYVIALQPKEEDIPVENRRGAGCHIKITRVSKRLLIAKLDYGTALENAMAILPSIMAAVMAVLPTERSLPGMKVVMIQPSNSSFFETFELSVRCFLHYS